MVELQEPVIYEAIRTPRGRVRREGGTLAGIASPDLFAGLLRELSARGVPAEHVDDVLVGVSTPHGEQAVDVARVAVMRAGWPDTVPGGMISRMCTSGLDAIASAAAQLRAGVTELMVAGGAESMSRVPMFADAPLIATDADWGEATGFVTIGVAADFTAARAGYSRAELDAYAVRSHHRSAEASWRSVVPVVVGGETILAADEGARADASPDSLGSLATLFGEDPAWASVEARFPGTVRPQGGLHTVGTAPQLSDAASAVLLGTAAAAEFGLRPRGRVVSWAHAAERSPRLDATVPAAHRALKRAGLTIADIAIREFNESFSVTPLLLARELGIPDDSVNLRGGAVAVGHPLGASGGILVANALDQLEDLGGGRALLVIPAALGQATAMVIETVD